MLALTCLSMALLHAAATPSVENAQELLDAWQLEDAMAMAQVLLAEAPSQPENWLLSAEVLHQRGEHLAALALLNALGDAGGARAANLRPMVEGSARYARDFQTLSTAHFKIRYLSKDEIVATYAEPVLEAAYRNIGDDLEFLPAERGEKIVVEIYPDARGLAGATGLTLKEIETSGTIAVCKFHRLMITSPLATADGYDWADTVAHEFTHLIISKKSHNTVTIWLHEGIAKFFESRWKGAAGQALAPYSEKLLAQAVRTNKYITYQQMYPSMAKLPSQDAAALAFAEVFTTVEFLTNRYGKKTIAQLLTELSRGAELEDALQTVYGYHLLGMEKAWHAYLNKRTLRENANAKPQTIRLAHEAEASPQEKPLEPIADKAAHDLARLGELLQLQHHPKAAIVEYEKAYAKAGTRYPTLVTRLARAYVDTGRSDAALTLLTALLAAHPDEADAHLIAGRLELKRSAWDAAQRHFEAVRLQNPYNPEIHLALAALYQGRGDTDGAAREKHFMELTQAPRPARDDSLPHPPLAEASLNIATLPWGSVRVDGGPALVTPAWGIPAKAGDHEVVFTPPSGLPKSQKIHLNAGDAPVLLLR